ncbi:tetraacyldisaccharide 4'-kinase [Spongiibacter sp. KMU-158]|uniref:Tetraacyldisaccharide 4'-kinase n=1 Tax=Spongiibacter pelagi TaxID=2760804 RepID=A0A927C1L8_9GAMM|nr:tetraacyldisaccharide 4'-kinase [Spongiibacter pelagi]MBD2859074.1 tetraacyldisaccharide 4'-kinase [Spongiibacter pelagi]
MALEHALNRAWYSTPGLLWLLLPLEGLFRLISSARRRWTQPQDCGAPVVVVGNIAVGGSGKTPVVIAVAEALQVAGFKPGIVSRGYGGKAEQYPYLLSETSLPEQAGDEPCLIYQRIGLAMAVAPDRVAAGRLLVEQYGCDVIISDDGLQHYRMARKVEILVVDAQRGFGNGHCLPVGPLREPVSRHNKVDLCVFNGKGSLKLNRPSFDMALKPSKLVNLYSGESRSIEQWPSSEMQVNAIAGIGHPQRFFDTLGGLGFSVSGRGLPDHHQPNADDLDFGNSKPLIMTEKDAVKCRHLAQPHHWMLPVDAQIDPQFYQQLIALLRA